LLEDLHHEHRPEFQVLALDFKAKSLFVLVLSQRSHRDNAFWISDGHHGASISGGFNAEGQLGHLRREPLCL